MTLRKCPDIQGSSFSHLNSQVAVSFDEVMDIKAYVKCYINDMNFFTIILKELTNVDTNDKKSGAHSLEHSVS